MAEEVPIYIMGKQYFVPEGITILRSLEFSGYTVIRGCGCRGGFCGACATVYRLPGDYQLHVGLACQTTIIPNMVLATIPFFPANKAVYNLEEIDNPHETLSIIYPEMSRCIGCNACTKVCPQDLNVMQYMQSAYRGDFKKTAELSFDCIMCGLCASRCVAQTVPYLVAMYARRICGKFYLDKPEFLACRIQEIEDGKYDAGLKKLMAAAMDDLKKIYDSRDIEKL